MGHSRALKLLLKRGALIAAANWPVVLVQFVADTVFNALLAVPVAGGVLLVMLLVGAEPAQLMRLPYREIIPALIGALLAQPVALAAFLGALGLVAAGGSVLMFAVKAGTLTVLVAGERAAGAIETPPLRVSALMRANMFSIERFTAGLRGLFQRYLVLGAMLAAAYAMAIGAYAFLVFGPPVIHLDATLIVTLASLWMIGLVTLINFLYLLTQIVIAADDCTVGEAVSRVARLHGAGHQADSWRARRHPRAAGTDDGGLGAGDGGAGIDRVRAVRGVGGVAAADHRLADPRAGLPVHQPGRRRGLPAAAPACAAGGGT